MKRQPRCTAADKALRVATVVEWKRAGAGRAEVIERAGEAWGVAARTVDGYLAEAAEQIAAEGRAMVREELADRRAAAGGGDEVDAQHFDELPTPAEMFKLIVNMTMETHAAAKIAGDVSVMQKCLDQLARLFGLYSQNGGKGDDAKAAMAKAVEGFEMMMRGAQASRAERGLAPIEGGGR